MAADTQRVAVVTGAAQGLGLQTCLALARQGIQVVLTARDAARAEQGAASLRTQAVPVETAVLDVTDAQSVAAFQAHFAHHHQRLDILINNAGIHPDRYAAGPQGNSVLLATPERMELAWRTHVLGPLSLIQWAVPLMRRHGYGRIVNVSSTLGQLAHMGGGWPAYRISKTALNALTGVVAAELAHDNILVNSVCPGWTRTALGGPQAPRDVVQGADTIVWLATLPDDGPRGGFFQDRQLIAW